MLLTNVFSRIEDCRTWGDGMGDDVNGFAFCNPIGQTNMKVRLTKIYLYIEHFCEF